MFNVLTVIPARGGSKGIKLKNLKVLQGVSLVGRAVKCSLQTNTERNIILSSDHPKIIEEGKKFGVFSDYIRPEHLSGDLIGDVDVLLDALKFAENNSSQKYDAVMMLQPTSPLRKETDIRDALNIFQNNDFDAIWSASEIDSKYHPRKILNLNESSELKYYHAEGRNIIARQQLSLKYIRNGAFYIINRDKLLETKSLMQEKTFGFSTDSPNISIDTEWDLKLAEFYLQNSLINV